jgi:hypothetical protein
VELTEQLPVAPNLSDRLPDDAGVITVFETEQLESAQTLTRLLRFVADWIWVLALALWAAAVYLARDRRKEVRAIAFGFVVVGVLVLLARRLAGRYLVDELSTSASDEEVVRRSWEILTRLLADAGWAVIAIGLVALVGVWLVGTSARGTAARAWLAPYLRNPAYAFGAAALIFALLVLWGPISYVERPSTLLVLAVLAALGVEVLRRKAARDFPDAVAQRPAPATPWARGRASSGPAEELERLARLHTEGVLNDEEFASAKARVLAMDTAPGSP